MAQGGWSLDSQYVRGVFCSIQDRRSHEWTSCWEKKDQCNSPPQRLSMPPAMRYLLTLSLFLSDKLTSERSAANKQIGKILQKFSQLAGLSRLVFFTYPCLSLLKPMSKSPRWQCRLSVVLLVTTLVRGLVGTQGLPGVYNRKYMSWARRKYIFGFILHILTCTTCLVVVICR